MSDVKRLSDEQKQQFISTLTKELKLSVDFIIHPDDIKEISEMVLRNL